MVLAGTLACRTAAPASSSETPLIRFERTACMGPCPVDVLTVYANGRMRYEGGQHAPRTGTHTGKLTTRERTVLLKQFETARFFDFARAYTSRATDLPTYYLTFATGGRSHRVEDYNGGPASLKKLEATLEKLIDANRWKQAPL